MSTAPRAPTSHHRVTAVLGPTNTGKTYLAIERMLGHTSGMIGFPLRLLARENYDRVVKLKGRNQVALVTGEEKILPPNPRYFLCTVESMPVDRPVEFLAVDEIQLCADPERGHLFTDRLLHARGLSETMFLGADTMRGMIKSLVPHAEVVSRPRFSVLTYTGVKKLTRLPPRSAVVAFSANDVYATAELMRRNRGGTAVVLGALSPRTRNAQVQMFEEGEVDYLVATDAIGMGLNLNLDHVAFARLKKFDGRGMRHLSAAEIGQIAGRAGRYMADGTFGTTANVGEIDEETVEAVESHRFDPVQALAWRNGELDFRSPELLLKSLEAAPPNPQLTRARDAEDYQALRSLARDVEIAELARDRGAVRLLWEVCQIPDFRKMISDEHLKLLSRVYRYLMRGEGRLPEDWVAKQIAAIDRIDGDIDSLIARIAHIRTWTYITHRGDWLAENAHWQERARAIEDRLSDALHHGLTQRFVDRRTATLVKRMKDGAELIGAVKRDGDVLVEGEYVGRLQGFRFTLDTEATVDNARPLLAAARRALASEIPARVKRLEQDDDSVFSLDDKGGLIWRGAPVARLTPAAEVLQPKIEVIDSDFLDGAQKERIRKRLADWLDRYTRKRLGTLFQLAEAELPAQARGLAFQLVEALGVLKRADVAGHARRLSRAERKALSDLGVRLGRESIWLPATQRRAPQRLKRLLAALHRGEVPEETPEHSAEVFWPDRATDEAACRLLGYQRLDGARRGRGESAAVAMRLDALERLSVAMRKLSPAGPFTPTAALAQLAGGDRAALAVVLPALGYPRTGNGETVAFRPRGTGDAKGAKPSARRSRGKRGKAVQAENPATEKPAPANAVPQNAAPDTPLGEKQPDKKPPKKPSEKPARRKPRGDPNHPFAKLRELTFQK